jgi:hypothetical protein
MNLRYTSLLGLVGLCLVLPATRADEIYAFRYAFGHTC